MIKWFEKLVGKGNVLEEEADKVVYSTDASQVKGNTRLVVLVENAKHVHQIILFAKRSGIDIVARGAGTGLRGGAVPQNSIVVDLSKMNKILEKKDDYVVVEPGVILDNLNEELGNKFFPIVPGSHSVCTIGGMISTNASSLRSIRYGRMENWVLEAEILDGTGRLRKVKENVCGNEGLTGIITKAKLKITDRIKERSLTVFRFDNLEKLVETVLRLRNNKEITAMEFISDLAASLCGLEKKNHLIVEYEGLEGKVIDEKKIKEILDKVDRVSAILALNNFKVREDPKIQLENMAEFLYWLKHKNIPCLGHIGIGVIHPFFDDRERIKGMFDVVNKLNGNACGEYGVGLLKKSHVNENFKKRVKRLKEVYDPEDLLNRGKVV